MNEIDKAEEEKHRQETEMLRKTIALLEGKELNLVRENERLVKLCKDGPIGLAGGGDVKSLEPLDAAGTDAESLSPPSEGDNGWKERMGR